MACEHTCCSTTGCGPGMCGQHYFEKSMDQPSMVANPSRLGMKKNVFFPFLPRSRLRFGLEGQVRPSHLAPAFSFSTLRLDLDLTYGIPTISERGLTCTANRHWILVPNSSGHAIAYRWRSLPRVWHRASSPQGSSRTGCCLFRFHHEPIFCAPLFFHTH